MSHAQGYSGFSVKEHSGDLAITAWGRDELEAYAEACYGLVAQAVPPELIDQRETVELSVTETDKDRRILAFLNEIIYLIFAKGWLPAVVHRMTVCQSKGCAELQVTLRGEPVDASRHTFKYDIKAVTFHDFRIETEPKRTVVHFVCDL